MDTHELIQRGLIELPLASHYCACCGVVRVRVEFEYCDACVDEIVRYLEQEEHARIAEANELNKQYDLFAQEQAYINSIENFFR